MTSRGSSLTAKLFLPSSAIFLWSPSPSTRSRPYDLFATALWNRARICLHEGKTRLWNAADEEPLNTGDWRLAAARACLDWQLSHQNCQGLMGWGSLLGHDDVVLAEQTRRPRPAFRPH